MNCTYVRLAGGSLRAYRAWPSAWPSPSGPQGSAEAPRARVGPEDAFCGAGFAERLERIFGCPCGWRGRPGQCAAFRPSYCDIFTAIGAPGARVTALAVVLAGAAAGYGGDRRRPVTGGAVRGSRRAVGLASEGRGEAAAPQRRDPRGEPRPPTAGHPGRSFPSTAPARPRCSRPGPSGPARRRCALEAVAKVVTNRPMALVRIRDGLASGCGRCDGWWVEPVEDVRRAGDL
jgi:hypothetical protein